MNFYSKVWKFFASVKLSIILLLSLAATSIIGTLIPQNENLALYYREYGRFLFSIFNALDIFDMYHSWWFRFLLVLLTVNIIVCSIDRLSSTWKIIFVNFPRFSISRFKKLSSKKEFTVNRKPEYLEKIYALFSFGLFARTVVEHTETGFCIFAEKWRLSRLGVYIVHLSVLLLLFGGLTGSIFGFEGFVNIPEGKTVSSIILKKTGQKHKLDFSIRCDDFSISFYDSGAPQEYLSRLTILDDKPDDKKENKKPVLTKDVIVNDPLRYKGINIYQSSYGQLSPKAITLKFISKKTEKKYMIKTILGQKVVLPEAGGTFVLADYIKSANFRGHKIGEAFAGTLSRPNQDQPDKNQPDKNRTDQDQKNEKINIILPIHFPDFDKMRKGDFIISVADYKFQYYTGLQVTRDPGVLIVYAGFIIMIAGCFITFFMCHQRFCIEVTGNKNKSRVMVAGFSNKNKIGMENRVKKISERLERLALLDHD